MFPRIAIALLISILAAGCTEMRWHKAGANSAALERDLEECRKAGRLQAERAATPRLAAAPIVVTDPQGRTILTQPNPHDTDRFLAEQDLTRACMRKQGYELVPAKQS